MIYANRSTAERPSDTDFAAPAYNVPTFRRTFTLPPTTTSTTAGSPTDHLTFTQVGTSMSAAIVTGAYALVSSALNYWITLAESNGYTADAYLNTPVGTDSLNFGKHAFKNLSAWNNPSGINGILAWTAVPATDANDGGSTSTPPTLARRPDVSVPTRPSTWPTPSRRSKGTSRSTISSPTTTASTSIRTTTA